MKLSKSRYSLGINCIKRLWLSINKSEVGEDINSSLVENGKLVGDIALDLFPGCFKIEYNEDYSKMIDDTRKIINNNKKCYIAEASFCYKDNFCSIDVLEKDFDTYSIYEVKSGTSLDIDYINDVSYQYYVLKSLGYSINKVYVLTINNKYERGDELEVDKLFTFNDVTNEVEDNYSIVENNIKDINNNIDNVDEDSSLININCISSELCPFFSYCTRNIEKPNVFSIHNLRKKKMIEYYNEGIITFKDLVKKEENPKYLEQIEYELYNKKEKIEKDNIKEFLDTLSYPMYFLDFETYQQVIPLYKGIHPYEQIPFQYSLHYIEKKDGEVLHKEFLAQEGVDPRRSISEALVRDIPLDVCVIAYNMSFEKKVLVNLSKLFPEYREHLLNISNNLKDLEIPFDKRYYYNRLMMGKSSIKYVLPALFPDDESLNYHNLEGVHNGSEAMNAFCNLEKLSEEERLKVREELLKYCYLDTYAMVKIYFKLLEVIKE